MNRYNSVKRTVWARNLYDAALSIPNDFVIQDTDWLPQIAVYGLLNIPIMNKNTNMNLMKLGVFSNFADGLVFSDPTQRLDAKVTALGLYQANQISSSASVVRGSKTLTGSGGDSFTTDLSSGDIVYFSAAGVAGERFYIIDSVTNDNSAELTDYALESITNNVLSKATPLASDSVYSISIPVLNYMVEIGEFFNPANFLTSQEFLEVIALKCEIINPADLTFFTKSISSDYDGDTAFFDMALEIEFTA